MTTCCDRWIECFTLLAEQGVPSSRLLAEIAEPDVRFRDPFNDVSGHGAVRRLFQHTLSHTSDLRFEVLDRAWSGQTVYIKWRMQTRVKVIGEWEVTGMSEVLFSDAGLVQSHIDYWDAAQDYYGKIPLIGSLLRLLARPARVA